MPTKKKQKPKSQVPAALLAGGAVGSVAAGEAVGHHYRGKALQMEELERHYRRKSGAPGGLTSGGYTADPKMSAAEHSRLADKYAEWAGRRGVKYPYMTPAANKEASERSYEHRRAIGGGSGYGRSSSNSTGGQGYYSGAGGRSRSSGSGHWSEGPQPGETFEDWFGRAAKGDRNYRSSWGSSEKDMYARSARSAGRAASEMRTFEHDARGMGRIGGAVLAAGAVGLGAHTWQENKHRRNHGKFATTGVKKNMDEVSKDFREELHRRAHDGRFQAGASGAAGAGLAGVALTANGSKHHRAEADRLIRQAQGHRDWAQGHRDKADKLKPGGSRWFHSGHAERNEAKRLHGIADSKFAEADAKEALAGRRLSQAASSAKRGKTAAAVWLGAGAAGAGAALYNRHRQQKLVSDLEGTAVTKNLSAEEMFSTAREHTISKLQPETKRGLKQGTVIGGVIGGGLGAAHAAANSHMGPKWGATAVGLNAAIGAGAGAAIGSSAGAERANRRIDTENAIRNVQRRNRVKKNLGAETAFAAARGDEVSKALWNDAAELAGKVGTKVKTGATTGAKFTGEKATAGFNATKPKVAQLGAKAKTQWSGQSQARKYTAVGAAGAAGGIGLGAAAQSRQNKPAY